MAKTTEQTKHDFSKFLLVSNYKKSRNHKKDGKVFEKGGADEYAFDMYKMAVDFDIVAFQNFCTYVAAVKKLGSKRSKNVKFKIGKVSEVIKD